MAVTDKEYLDYVQAVTGKNVIIMTYGQWIHSLRVENERVLDEMREICWKANPRKI